MTITIHSIEDSAPWPRMLNGARVMKARHTIFIAIPASIRRGCGGCSCDYCKARPNHVPQWDTLAVDESGTGYATIVHYPEFAGKGD